MSGSVRCPHVDPEILINNAVREHIKDQADA